MNRHKGFLLIGLLATLIIVGLIIYLNKGTFAIYQPYREMRTPITSTITGGPRWQSLGEGVRNQVDNIAVDSSGRVYASAYSMEPGLFRWEGGTSWSQLSDGGNLSAVNAFVIDRSGNLYAFGQGIGSGHVFAKWDGSSWSVLGRAEGYRLWIDSSDNLYTNSNDISHSRYVIKKFDGSHWLTVNGEFNDTIIALGFDSSGNLYASGYFTSVGGILANRIAKWNGTSWSALGMGLNLGIVNALACDSSGNLYAGGNYTTAGGVTANRIAKWDGTSWSALGRGLNGQVKALAFDSSGNLYVGGAFTIAGGITANHIAKCIPSR